MAGVHPASQRLSSHRGPARRARVCPRGSGFRSRALGCTSRFVSAVLCGGVSSFPEGFEAAAEDAAAQGEDGIGAVDGPVHAGALEARPDGMFAAGLDDAGGDAQAPGPERHAKSQTDALPVLRAFRFSFGPGVQSTRCPISAWTPTTGSSAMCG